MALKAKLTADEFEKLAEALKEHYKKDGAGYVLDTDDASELKSAKDREAEKRKDAEKKLREAQAELDALKDKASRESGDVAALDASYKQKLADATKRGEDAEAALAALENKVFAGEAIDKIAARFTVPHLIKPLLQGRTKVEKQDGTPIVRVLDANGKPSAMSLADLEKEFVDNPAHKGIVIASKASGSADPARPTPGSAGDNVSQSSRPDYTKMDDKSLQEAIGALVNQEA